MPPDGTPIGLLLVLTYATYVPTYTGIVYLTVPSYDRINLEVQGRDYGGLTVQERDFDLYVEKR